MIITFCGHSQFPKPLEYEEKLHALLEKIVGDSAADMYLGDYGDFDSLAYNCCKKYKETHPNVSLIFITPYITPGYSRNHLEIQKGKYDAIIYPEIEDKPLKFAISYRNKWMVERADCVICGIMHKWGGAYTSYQHALRKKKAIYNIVDK